MPAIENGSMGITASIATTKLVKVERVHTHDLVVMIVQRQARIFMPDDVVKG